MSILRSDLFSKQANTLTDVEIKRSHMRFESHLLTSVTSGLSLSRVMVTLPVISGILWPINNSSGSNAASKTESTMANCL